MRASAQRSYVFLGFVIEVYELDIAVGISVTLSGDEAFGKSVLFRVAAIGGEPNDQCVIDVAECKLGEPGECDLDPALYVISSH